jgi:hypothetical protein
MKACKVCGTNKGECHHIVFRSQASYMVNVPINQIYLCPKHHRGDNGPHLDRKVDLKYKMELQKTLFQLFPRKYYSFEEIKDILQISNTEAYKIVRKMYKYPEGFRARNSKLK